MFGILQIHILLEGFMRKIFAVLMTAVTCMLILSVLPVHGESEVYDSVLRLHVIANSDSDEDQALKLKVRDAILSSSGELFMGCKTKDDAVLAAESNKEELIAVAREVILAEGYDYSVDIEIGVEEYPRKNYDSFCFPSGEYASLQVKIGEAEGENWWCVLYPPLCLSAATQKQEIEEEFISVGLTDEQYKIITESGDKKYQLRFKFLEVVEDIVRN